MRRFLSTVLVAGGLLVASPAFAQQQVLVAGNVYQTAPNGMYVQNSNGIVFVPSAQAAFRIGGVSVNLAAGPPVAIGAPVQCYVPANYPVQYVPEPVFQNYYSTHRNWDWNHHVNQWHSDRRYWVNDHGNWRDSRYRGGGHGHGHDHGYRDHGHGHGRDHERGHGHHHGHDH